MKNKFLLISVLSMSSLLIGCGSDSNSNSSTDEKTAIEKQLISEMSGTWKNECFPVYDVENGNKLSAYNTIVMTVDSDLSLTSSASVYDAADNKCESNSLLITMNTKIEVKGKAYSDESYEAYAVDVNKGEIVNGSWNTLSTTYTLVYIESEKFYFGQQTGNNTGESDAKRHSSLNLVEYFNQVIN
ncbi:hypothetical protein L4D77_24055 [Photobacterium frigidiphilum]|uniref:Lipocalin-like domain-containing protein n=1 Tax=Photobacterium frigidiphilum TaxID=264736 RepID=A0A2T3JME3_9GAMM|nr:hypothetical protein [Photobacterium frigidiphilum]PSU50204.1 hypothetical protein C9J12_05585 [Photobacterium frigidiphilum]